MCGGSSCRLWFWMCEHRGSAGTATDQVASNGTVHGERTRAGTVRHVPLLVLHVCTPGMKHTSYRTLASSMHPQKCMQRHLSPAWQRVSQSHMQRPQPDLDQRPALSARKHPHCHGQTQPQARHRFVCRCASRCTHMPVLASPTWAFCTRFGRLCTFLGRFSGFMFLLGRLGTFCACFRRL